MATATTAKQGTPIGTVLFTLTETSTTASAVNMDGGGGSIIMIEIDNSSNTAAAYVSLYAAGSATVGTTDEDYVFMAPASTRITYACPEGAAYATGLTGAIVSAPGGSTGPGVTVTAYILSNT